MVAITELTIGQRLNNSITDLEYIKSYLSAILKPSSAKIVIPMLDDISEVLRDSAADTATSIYMHTPQMGEVAFEMMQEETERNTNENT